MSTRFWVLAVAGTLLVGGLIAGAAETPVEAFNLVLCLVAFVAGLAAMDQFDPPWWWR